ncbi:MAG: GDSL-type esterase/lipase family protein [Acutalibacteraceae bacterium]
MKILFQGDSITDANRVYDDYYDLGQGYAKYAAQGLLEKYPDIEFEFINRGINGNQTMNLVERLQSDFVDLQPDIISILIGVNDTWHHAEKRDWIPNDVFESRYRTVLSTIREKTNAKIMMIEPFLIPVEDKLFFREDLDFKIDIERKLAREFTDVYLPTDGLLAAEFIGSNPIEYAADGVHPTSKGARFIGGLYVQYVSKLVEQVRDNA